MIQVVAGKNWSLYEDGEVVTKLNERGEEVLRNALQFTTDLSQTNSVEYDETINLYVSLFGHRPEGH